MRLIKKILFPILSLLVIPAVINAGFNLGLINAAKKKVDKVDEKVTQSTRPPATTTDTQTPTVPTNLTAVAVSSCQINLSWTASTDNVGVTHYKIYRDGGATPIATPTGTTYNNTGLTALTAYSYTVSACDAAGNCSAQSVPASTTTSAASDTQAPTVPTNLTAVAVSSCQINLSWTAATDNVGVTSYKIYRNGGVTPIATPTGTTYSDTGLAVLTAYSYTISACDAAGNCSAQSVSVSTTTPDTQPPTVPTNLAAVAVSSFQINLSWTASTDDVGVTSYKIYRDGGATPIATPTGITYSNTGLSVVTAYSYTVRACDAAGNCSAQSVSASTTTPDTQAPTVPINLAAVAVSSFQINLSWTASTDDVGVTNYKLYRDWGATPIATPTGTTYNNTGLTAVTEYFYQVSACDAAGNCSALSVFASTKTLDTQAPTVPTNLTAVAVSSFQINISWTASTDNVGVTYYKIYRNGGATPIDLAGGTAYYDTGLTELTVYAYTVSACDAAGNCSAQSSAASDTTPPGAGGVWLFVPGNSSLGTSDFWVMKYEAKNVSGVPKSTPYSPGPWVSITQTAAKAACVALGSGYHLLTMDEAQTISRNIEGVGWNWTGGSVGNGGLWRGHSDGSPNNMLATADVTGDPDDDPYVGTGHSSPSIEKRVHKLSTTKYIWDWSGNAAEWLDLTCTGGTGVGFWQTTGWLEWDNAALQDYERGKAGPLGNYTSAQNAGQYSGCNVNGNVAYRGGIWIGTVYTGVFSFSADAGPSVGDASIGFRCGR